MNRPAVEVADILRAQGDRFLDRYPKSFGFQQLKAFRAIQFCRTAALGGHIDACPRCGYQAAISYYPEIRSLTRRHCREEADDEHCASQVMISGSDFGEVGICHCKILSSKGMRRARPPQLWD